MLNEDNKSAIPTKHFLKKVIRKLFENGEFKTLRISYIQGGSNNFWAQTYSVLRLWEEWHQQNQRTPPEWIPTHTTGCKGDRKQYLENRWTQNTYYDYPSPFLPQRIYVISCMLYSTLLNNYFIGTLIFYFDVASIDIQTIMIITFVFLVSLISNYNILFRIYSGNIQPWFQSKSFHKKSLQHLCTQV